MRATRLKAQSKDGYVCLELSKGVWLVLTVAQYVAGLNKGKAERRAQRRQQHLERRQGQQDAARLGWITE